MTTLMRRLLFALADSTPAFTPKAHGHGLLADSTPAFPPQCSTSTSSLANRDHPRGAASLDFPTAPRTRG
jgi:hypothetical protein